MRQQKAVDEAVYQEIATRRTEDCSKRQDILSLMMTARDETGEAMKDYELRDELMTLMLAGHETHRHGDRLGVILGSSLSRN